MPVQETYFLIARAVNKNNDQVIDSYARVCGNVLNIMAAAIVHFFE